MDFNRAQQEYQRLKTLYGQGDLTAEEFEAACNEKLVVRDQFGCVWQIGVNSGKWYCFEKGVWTQKEPEGAAPPAHNAVDVPETLQSVPKPAPILSAEPRSPDLGQPDDSEARPVPEAKLKSAQNRSKTQVRSTFSWLLLAGLVIVLLAGLSGLGLLLVREQRFGWNPRTPVRFGSPHTNPPVHPHTGCSHPDIAGDPHGSPHRHPHTGAQPDIHRGTALRPAGLGANPGHLFHSAALRKRGLADRAGICRGNHI